MALHKNDITGVQFPRSVGLEWHKSNQFADNW
jgi:hypothetical protein